MNIFKQISGIITDIFEKYQAIWGDPLENAAANTQCLGINMEAYCYFMCMNAVHLKRLTYERLAEKFMRAFLRHNKQLFISSDLYHMKTWEILKERTLDSISRYKYPGECHEAYMNRMLHERTYDSALNPPVDTAKPGEDKTTDARISQGVEIVSNMRERIESIIKGVNPKFLKRHVQLYQRTILSKILRVAITVLLISIFGFILQNKPTVMMASTVVSCILYCIIDRMDF